MSEHNKVLDVTYGAFSCRLEGFDDSVETLKTVVGYFHELAGEAMFSKDSPAVPNLDTLEEVVSRDTGSPVGVTQDDNGISLRVLSEATLVMTPPTEEDTPDEAHAADSEGETTSDADDLAAFAAEDSDFYEEDADFEEPVSDLQDDTADAEAPAVEATADEDIVETEAHTGDVYDDLAEDIAETDAPTDDTHDEVAQELDASDEQVAEAVEEDVAVPDAPAAEAPDAVPQPPAATTNFYELNRDARVDQDATETAEDTADDAVADETSDAAAAQEPTAPDHDAADADDASAADKLQRIRAVVGRGTPPTEETFAEDLGEEVETAPTPKAANPLAQRLAELAKRNSELMDADARMAMPKTTEVKPLQLDEEARIDADDTPAEQAEAEEANEASYDTAEAATKEADPAPLVLENDASDDSVTQVAEDAASRPLVLTTPSAPLTEADDLDDDDDDFDLHEEVAKIEEQLASRRGNEMARHGLPRSVEDAMSRIMTKTDIELDMEETRDNRDAFAQLKAAVAATEAARQLGDRGPKTREVTRMFRDELGKLEQSEDDAAKSGASLKVVDTTTSGKSTLREVAPLNEAAARLREIAQQSKDNADAEAEMTFTGFLAAHDVEDLADKLEAAASFLCLVENEEDFSRPQLMRVVQSEVGEEISREDGLRSFGRLLRQARIVKLANGRFTVADNTRFRPTGGQAAQG